MPGETDTWLDDVKLTSLESLTIEWAKDSITVATLRIAVDDLDIDAESAQRLIAMVKSTPRARSVATVMVKGDTAEPADIFVQHVAAALKKLLRDKTS